MTNDTILRLNIIRFASVSKMWRLRLEGLPCETETGQQLRDNESLGANHLKMLHLYFN